jgi:hypothetical protein
MDEDFELIKHDLEEYGQELVPDFDVRLNRIRDVVRIADKLAYAILAEREARESGHTYGIQRAWEQQYKFASDYLALREPV